jgi:arylsulfatase A-like enzyme
MSGMFQRLNLSIASLFCLFLLGILIYASSGCSKPHASKVILISIDALRPDFLSCYNPAIKTSPNIDRIASEGILCTDVISQAASTTLSHKSILYSLYPSIHKTSMTVLPKETTPSPLEILQSKGFKTAAFVGGGQLSRKFGFSKGFDSYWEPSEDVERNNKLKEWKPVVFEWLQKNHSQKFFLFLHTYQVHCPYFPPEEYRLKFASWYKGPIEAGYLCQRDYNNTKMTPEDYRYIRALYAAEVNYVDHFIGELLTLLKTLKIQDETMIILLGDHGESLGERGFIGHNQLYNVQLHIPLILRIPGVKPKRLTTPLESLDVMPTIFDVLGLGRLFPFQGKSLLPLLRHDGEKDRYRISEKKAIYSVQQGKWKAIFSRRDTNQTWFYNLENDPEEKNNVNEYHLEKLEELRKAYARMETDARGVSAKFIPREVMNPEQDPELREELKALGYIQ